MRIWSKIRFIGTSHNKLKALVLSGNEKKSHILLLLTKSCILILQRKQVWIPEEEIFADILIKLFKNRDADEPIRMFINAKLHCSQMTISKFFYGKDLEKQ